MIFEAFAPTTGQQLDHLRALRSRILTMISAGGGVFALLKLAIMF